MTEDDFDNLNTILEGLDFNSDLYNSLGKAFRILKDKF